MLPRLAGLISREREGYEYLAESIESFPSGETMKQPAFRRRLYPCGGPADDGWNRVALFRGPGLKSRRDPNRHSIQLRKLKSRLIIKMMIRASMTKGTAVAIESQVQMVFRLGD